MKSLEGLQALIGVLVLVVVVFLYARRAIGPTRGKRTTTNSNVLEVMDEVFSPARHTAAIELRTRLQQGPVTPVPDDWLPGPDGLHVHVKRKGAHGPTGLRHSTSPVLGPSVDFDTSGTGT